MSMSGDLRMKHSENRPKLRAGSFFCYGRRGEHIYLILSGCRYEALL